MKTRPDITSYQMPPWIFFSTAVYWHAVCERACPRDVAEKSQSQRHRRTAASPAPLSHSGEPPDSARLLHRKASATVATNPISTLHCTSCPSIFPAPPVSQSLTCTDSRMQSTRLEDWQGEYAGTGAQSDPSVARERGKHQTSKSKPERVST